MQEQLKAFVRLAEIDASARHIDEQLEGIPIELEERRVAVKALEDLVRGQKLQMDEAVALLQAQEEDLKLRSDMLARSKAKGAKARNMREAQAAERELDAIRRSIREGEAEKERLQGVIEQTERVLAEPLAELEAQQQALKEAEVGSAARLEELEREKAVATDGRAAAAREIPKRIFRRYERLRTQLHPTLCEAKDGVCQGCQLSIAPQLYNQIIRGDDFYQCLQCQRFLYHARAVAEPGRLEPEEVD